MCIRGRSLELNGGRHVAACAVAGVCSAHLLKHRHRHWCRRRHTEYTCDAERTDTGTHAQRVRHSREKPWRHRMQTCMSSLNSSKSISPLPSASPKLTIAFLKPGRWRTRGALLLSQSFFISSKESPSFLFNRLIALNMVPSISLLKIFSSRWFLPVADLQSLKQ